MKKILCAFLVMVFAVSFVACNNQKPNETIEYIEPVSKIDVAKTSVYETCGIVFTSTRVYLTSEQVQKVKDVYAGYTYEKFEGEVTEIEKSESSRAGLYSFPTILFTTDFDENIRFTFAENKMIYVIENDADKGVLCKYKSSKIMTNDDYNKVLGTIYPNKN